ncbi:MAG: VOC family protein [Bacteroidota bacterium]
MKIEHLAIWVRNIEELKTFYEKYFDAKSNKIYHNKTKDFRSYFLSFGAGPRLEIMQMTGIQHSANNESNQSYGLIHFAISVGSKELVDSKTDELRAAGYKIIGEPRTTGDGYYESVVLDPEHNRIEITV